MPLAEALATYTRIFCCEASCAKAANSSPTGVIPTEDMSMAADFEALQPVGSTPSGSGLAELQGDAVGLVGSTGAAGTSIDAHSLPAPVRRAARC